MADENPAVVIDNGSGRIKAGFAAEEGPRVVVPNIVGTPKFNRAMVGVSGKDMYVAEEAQKNRGVLLIQYPVKNGKIMNWDQMEKVWHSVFYNELRVAPEDQPVFLTEAPLNPKENRERMASVMFETFGVPGCFISVQALMTLYAAGKTTGIVLDSGDGVTHSVPVYEGFVTSNATKRLDCAGREVTQNFRNALSRAGHDFTSTAELEIVRNIKEQHCFVAENFDTEMANYNTSPSEYDINYELPDGSVITFSKEAFEAPECLFDPQILNNEQAGCSDMLYSSIQSVEIDIRREMYGNVVISGGTTMIRNIENRIQYDLVRSAPKSVDVKLIAPPNRYYSVWIGSAILTALAGFSERWIKKSEYEESGPSIVHRSIM